MAISRRQIIERRKARWESFRKFIYSLSDTKRKKVLLKEVNKNIYYEEKKLRRFNGKFKN
jgi:hypothetical protein